MNARLVEEIANAVLYEGYLLYPYRASALKNRQRFNFGVVAPREHCETSRIGDSWFQQTECLVRCPDRASVVARVRWLHAVARVDDVTVRSLQEAVEREAVVRLELGDHASVSDGEGAASREGFSWPASREVESRGGPGDQLRVITRSTEQVMGEVTLSSQRVRRDIWKVSVSVRNLTPCPAGCTADALQMRSFLSTHAILHVGGGEWLSLLDPPADARDLVPSCLNVGVWPVMVGEAHERDAMLASPIILYDYPKIAPESAGEFFDSTEIDEMLSLRILTMTDREKQEMRDGDERARRMLERTERLSSGDLLKLHGVLRELRPLDEEAP